MPLLTLDHTGKKVLLADLALFIVAVFWGLNFVIKKLALNQVGPFTYLALRFGLGALLLLIIFRRKIFKVSREDLLYGLLAGLFLCGGFSFQTFGLLQTTPAKSGFITGMCVVMVPIFNYVIAKVSPGWWVAAGGALAAAGLFLLTADPGSLLISFQLGDSLTLVSAIFFAVHMVVLGLISPGRDPVMLATIQLAVTGAATLPFSLILEPRQIFNLPPAVWGAIIFAVIFCTAGAYIIQTAAQRHTPAAHVAIITCLDAVFAGLFSYLIINECFTLLMISGAGLILLGMAVAELPPLFLSNRLQASGRPAKKHS